MLSSRGRLSGRLPGYRDPGALTWFAFNLEPTADQFGPLAHRPQSQPTVALFRFKAAAIVIYGECDLVVRVNQPDAGCRSAAVTGAIGQRFLADAVQRLVYLQW
jgi:hypothetical protein